MSLGTAALRAGHAMLLIGTIVLLAPTAHARSYPNIFGSKEIASQNWKVKTSAIVNWNAMLQRWQKGAPCESSTCTAKGWSQLVAKVKAAGDRMAMIRVANELMNDPVQHPYLEDINNWGQADYWATTFQFLKKSGDCEDYAIAKYMLLKAVGYPIENMRIVAVRIRSLGGLGHAVLVVYEGNDVFVLDNRVAAVMNEKLVRVEFQPALSVNEQYWWIHLPDR